MTLGESNQTVSAKELTAFAPEEPWWPTGPGTGEASPSTQLRPLKSSQAGRLEFSSPNFSVLSHEIVLFNDHSHPEMNDSASDGPLLFTFDPSIFFP